MHQPISEKETAPTKATAVMKNMVPWNERFSYSLSDFACNLSFQMVGTYLMIFYTDTFGISAAAVGMVAFFGGGSTTSAHGWFIWALIVGVIVVLIFAIVFKNTKERVQTKSSRQSIPIRESLKALKKNWPWAIIIFINFIYWLGMQTRSQVTVYFFKYNMHNAGLASFVLSLQFVSLLAVVLTPLTSKLIGKRNTMLLGMVMAIVGQLLLSIGATHLSVPMIIFATIIGYLGTGYVSGLIAVMLADAVDYGEWKNGVRAEGIVTSFSSFSAKLGMGIGGVITGWILSVTHYVANQSQSASALHGIELNYIWVPLLGFGLSAVALLFYHVDSIEKKMQSDLAAKHAKENADD